jgi:hypothetical protein
VWFTVKALREMWWETSAGAVDTRVLCASLASGREVGGMLGIQKGGCLKKFQLVQDNGHVVYLVVFCD